MKGRISMKINIGSIKNVSKLSLCALSLWVAYDYSAKYLAKQHNSPISPLHFILFCFSICFIGIYCAHRQKFFKRRQ